jgi:hypothetical protein
MLRKIHQAAHANRVTEKSETIIKAAQNPPMTMNPRLACREVTALETQLHFPLHPRGPVEFVRLERMFEVAKVLSWTTAIVGAFETVSGAVGALVEIATLDGIFG